MIATRISMVSTFTLHVHQQTEASRSELERNHRPCASRLAV